MISMADTLLAIPFSIPILGESFTSIGNPLILSALDFFVQVGVTKEESKDLDVPLNSPSLRHAIESYLKTRGVSGKFSIKSNIEEKTERDFLGATSLLFLSGMEGAESAVPALLSRVEGKAFITLARALTSISGGFVVCRRGEGLISLEGGIDASVHLRIQHKGLAVQRVLNSFSASFPELASPLWHLLGHLVLEGGKAVRENDAPTLGKLISLEGMLAHSLGLTRLRDLNRVVRLRPAYGGKAICSEAFMGELILAPKETLPLTSYDRFRFTSSGVREVGSS
jgi:hypothetical protein